MNCFFHIKKVYALIALFLCCLLSAVSFSFAFYVSKINEKQSQNYLNGSIKTTQYFDHDSYPSSSDTWSAGETEAHPFIITTPRHLYNLSRLNAFGLFGTTKYYFQLGKQISGDTTHYYVYASGHLESETLSSSNDSTILDMSSWDYATYPFSPIGSEAKPFFSEFKGNSLTISGLSVTGNQEDVGVFGYVASKAKVSSIIFSKLTVNSFGYSSSNNLYADSYQTNANTNWKLYYGASELVTSTDVALSSSNHVYLYYNGGSGSSYTSQGTSATVSGITYSYISGYNTVIASDGTFDTTNVFNTTNMAAGTSFTDPMYIVASYTDSNHNYISSVIKTYDVTFKNDAGTFKITAAAERTNKHGYNIGYIAGHADGTIESSYVSDISTDQSVMNVNGSATGYTGIANNTAYGLIGLVSPNHSSNSLGTYSDDGEGDIQDAIIYYNSVQSDTARTVNGSISALVSNYSTTDVDVNNYDWRTAFSLKSTSDISSSSSTTFTVASRYSSSTFTNSSGATVNYYSNGVFNFPGGTIDLDGTNSYNYRSFSYNLLADGSTSSNVYFNVKDTVNRQDETRSFIFESQGKGRIVCLYSASATANQFVMMRHGSTRAIGAGTQLGSSSSAWSTNIVTAANNNMYAITSTAVNGLKTSKGSGTVYLGRDLITNGTSYCRDNNDTAIDTIHMAYFDIPEAGYYFFGGGGGANIHLQYMRFIYAHTNSSSGGGSSTTPTLLTDTVSDVDFSATSNSTNYLSGTIYAFREAAASVITVSVYFNSTTNLFVMVFSSSSSTAESVTVTKGNLTKTGYTYPASTTIYLNSTSNAAYSLAAGSNKTFSLSSTSTAIT